MKINEEYFIYPIVETCHERYIKKYEKYVSEFWKRKTIFFWKRNTKQFFPEFPIFFILNPLKFHYLKKMISPSR